LKVEKKNKLYFNKYKFKASCRVLGAAYTYYTKDIETFKNRIEKWKTESNRYSKTIRNLYDIDQWNNIDYNTVEKFINLRESYVEKDCIIRIQGDTVSVFANDTSLIQPFEELGSNFRLYQVEVLDNNSIFLKRKSKYNYRTYFKGRRVTKEFLEGILDFDKMYGHDTAKISPALLTFLQRRAYNQFMYMHGSYFIDYKSESFLSILHMHFPNMIAKTFKLEVEPKD
jgi:hypothetical protein